MMRVQSFQALQRQPAKADITGIFGKQDQKQVLRYKTSSPQPAQTRFKGLYPFDGLTPYETLNTAIGIVSAAGIALGYGAVAYFLGHMLSKAKEKVLPPDEQAGTPPSPPAPPQA